VAVATSAGRGIRSRCTVPARLERLLFNRELAEYWSNAGARFFALDLRKYGRSIRPGQTPGYITDLADYDADIEAALAAMGHGHESTDATAASARSLILLGHSTGGLTLSLWAARHPGRAAAIVLNSPWLEFQGSRIGREALAPVVRWGARVNPMGPMPNVDLGFYARSVAKEQDGEWEYSHAWRPDRGFEVHPAWLTAILADHATVAAGIDVGAPVLALLSARSTIAPRWDAAMLTTDIVLVVDDIAERVLKLGPEVSVARIDGALHDMFLSREPARDAAYASITRWLRGYGPRS
jgi:alpha-beta hydrolase superfamily lysophospholipase